VSDERASREKDFWGHHLPGLEEALAQYAAGPDPNTEAMLRAVGAVEGASVLDFACAGVVTAWLSARGAAVVGLDLSPDAIVRARELLDALGLDARLVATSLEDADELGTFDAIVGRYALHHTDVARLAPDLAARLRPGGVAAFVETFASNPVLRLCRRWLVDRAGIPRFGTLDERPLDRAAVAALASAFGEVRTEVAQLRFLRIFDRQVLRYRSERLGSALSAIDDLLARLPGSTALSYHQVIVLHKATG
jgi:SAM-dependent methyltransferase